jgi:hypothetical protein
MYEKILHVSNQCWIVLQDRIDWERNEHVYTTYDVTRRPQYLPVG